MKKRTPKRITKSPAYKKAFVAAMRAFSEGTLYRSTGGKVETRAEAQAIGNAMGAAAQGVVIDQYNRIIGPAGAGCACGSGAEPTPRNTPKKLDRGGGQVAERWYDKRTRSWVVQLKSGPDGDQLGEAIYVAREKEAASAQHSIGSAALGSGAEQDLNAAHYNVLHRGKKRLFVPFRGAAAELDDAGNVVQIIRPTKRDVTSARGGDVLFAALAHKFGVNNVERQRSLFAGATEAPRAIIGKAGQRDAFAGSGALPGAPRFAIYKQDPAPGWYVMDDGYRRKAGPFATAEEADAEVKKQLAKLAAKTGATPLDAAREAARAYTEAQRRYRAREIGDAEYLAARKVYEESERAFDAARGETPPAPVAFAPMPTAEPGEIVLDIPVEQIDADPDQPRKHFDPEALRELAESMRSIGQIQPVLVRPHPTERGRYMMVAGERRWRAAQKAGLPFLKAVARELHGEQVAAAQLAENEVRRQTTESEAARFVVSRIASGDSPASIARALGRSPHWVETRVLIAKLSTELQAQLDAGKITVGTAAALGELPAEVQRNTLEAAQLHSKLGRGQEAYIRAVKLKEAGKDLFGQSILEHVSGLSPKKRRALGNKLDRLLRCSGGLAALPDKDLLAMVESGERNPGAVEAEVTLLLRGLRRVLGSIEKVRAARAVGECIGVCQK